MALTAVPLAFVLFGLTCYIILAGADFGAAIWQITAPQTREGRRIRDFAHNVMAPVWEANHVWLIFVLTLTWTAYPAAFGSIASTLSIALIVTALGSSSAAQRTPCPPAHRVRGRFATSTSSAPSRRSSRRLRSVRASLHRVGASPVRQGPRGSGVELAQPDLGGHRRAGNRDLRVPGRRLPL